MDVALYGGEDDFPLGADDFAGGGHLGFFGLHERGEIGDGFFHHAGGFYDLRKEHLAGTEEVADDAHARHERAFDDEQRAAEFGASLLGIGVDVGVDAAHEGVREALFDGAVAPFFGFFFGDGGLAGACGFEGFTVIHEALGSVGTTVEEDVFDEDFQLGLDVLVDLEHAGVDDAHVHAGADRMVEKRGVHGFANLVVAAEAEADVRDAA